MLFPNFFCYQGAFFVLMIGIDTDEPCDLFRPVKLVSAW